MTRREKEHSRVSEETEEMEAFYGRNAIESGDWRALERHSRTK